MKNVGRKFFHVLGGLTLLAIYETAGRPRAFYIYGILLAVTLSAEVIRMRMPSLNEWLFSRFGSFVRPSEKNTVTGIPPYILGAALTYFFFSRETATAALLFLVFGDVAATLVGESWGQTKMNDKSLEGTAAFVAACLLVGTGLKIAGFALAFPQLAAGTITAAAVELFSPRRLNDNLSIPILSAAVMTVVGMAGIAG